MQEHPLPGCRLLFERFCRVAQLWQLLAACSAQTNLTGSIRAENGDPVPGMRVVLFAERTILTPGAVAPLQAVTDQEGAFSFSGLQDRPYCGWAVAGKTSPDRATLVVTPQSVVSGAVEWTAVMRSQPSEVRLRGTNAWREHFPLWLRVDVRRNATIVEMPVVSDGFLALPSLPTSQVTLALVGAGGRILCQQAVDLDRVREIDYGDTATVTFTVRDADGSPIEGVRVCELVLDPNQATTPLLKWVKGIDDQRVIATTDASGRAVAQVWKSESLDLRCYYGEKNGFSSDVSGFTADATFDPGGLRSSADRSALAIRMRREEAAILTINRIPKDVQLTACLVGGWSQKDDDDFPILEIDTASAPIAVTDSGLAATVPTNAGLRWQISGQLPRGEVPHPIVAAIRLPVANGKAQADWDALPRTTVHVLDAAGKGTPGALVGFAASDEASTSRTPWLAVAAAAADGKIGAVGAPVGSWVYATNGVAHACERTPSGAAPLRVRLKPFVEVEVAVVAAHGRPVPGATIEVEVVDEPDPGLPTFALQALPSPLFPSRTDAKGLASCLVPAELRGLLRVTARLADAVSAPAHLVAGRVELTLSR